MPLRATSDTGDIHAFALDAAQWAELKGNYKPLNLRMPCCQVPAVPKTSTLGNFFFAHARRGGCTTAPESAEHLYCKAIIARAAQDAGWTVTTERPGASPVGEEWVADVFCERGSAKIAIEVQMSPQQDGETIRRQLRYKASGVRGAWFYSSFVRRGEVFTNRTTPAFVLSPVEVGQIPRVTSFEVPLPEFVVGMLSKRLEWTVPDDSNTLHVEYLNDTCWACKKPVKQAYGYFEDPEDADGDWHERALTIASLSSDLQGVQAVVDNSELIAAGLNLIAKQSVSQGKVTKAPFYCNLCLHCRAPQNNFHLGEKLRAALYEGADELDGTGVENDGDDVGGQPSLGLAALARMHKGAGYWEFKAAASTPVAPAESLAISSQTPPAQGTP